MKNAEGIVTSIRRNVQEQEPVGIVISRGTREEAAPRFSAYVWGPAPQEASETAEPRAA